jgi:hypothetical protein
LPTSASRSAAAVRKTVSPSGMARRYLRRSARSAPAL